MKLIVLLAVVSVAAAQEATYAQGSDRDAEIIRNDFDLDEQGGFAADMETSNQIQQSSAGQSFPGPEPETGSYTMSGQYSYQAPNGEIITVVWTADENGYNAESDSIPKLSDAAQAAIGASALAAPIADDFETFK